MTMTFQISRPTFLYLCNQLCVKLQIRRRNTWSTSHYNINLRVVLEVVRKVFLLQFVASATPLHSVHDVCISVLERFFYSTLGYGAMIAVPAQLFYELGIDVDIPKAALKLLLDVLLAPDLQEQLSFRIAPYASLFCHLFLHVLGRLTT